MASSNNPNSTVPANGVGGKRKREAAPSVMARPAVPALKGGTELMTHVHHSETFLKERKTEQSFQDIINYLSIQMSDDALLHRFKFVLQRAEHVQYNPRGLDGKGSYKYKPIIPVENAEDLKAYLQKRSHAIGVKYDNVKDGWAEALEGVNQMADKGELLVCRDKRGIPKAVWQGDPSLVRKIDDDLRNAWLAIKLPANPDEMRDKLEAAGLKTTTQPRQAVKMTQQKAAKKRGPRKGGRTTNSHISHLLKDYSAMRK